ncbi:MAG TPA: PIG-L deacetylase family protein [Pirellulales bacterium]|nr:PIG-L deacetylase family protein [Pirellulales bacterium]
MPEPLRLLILGAHPDDAEFHAGGLAAIYRSAGHAVKVISLTNGDAGHHVMSGQVLAKRRAEEMRTAAAVIGAEQAMWSHHDGMLEPSLALRWQVIRELRTFQPDLVLTHRDNDYHPDHRACGNVVRDASYLVTVPTIVPDAGILHRPPVIAYLPDRFTRPNPLRGDVVIDVGSEVEKIVDMLACHESQVFEWLPFNRGATDEVPADKTPRRAWLRQWFLDYLRPQADRYRQELIATYGAARGEQIEYAEAFEISEYAAPLDADTRRRLFPFLPT